MCEFIKQSDFDGVMYSSSIGNGYNIALFGEEKVNGIAVTQHQISSVKWESETLSS